MSGRTASSIYCAPRSMSSVTRICTISHLAAWFQPPAMRVTWPRPAPIKRLQRTPDRAHRTCTTYFVSPRQPVGGRDNLAAQFRLLVALDGRLPGAAAFFAPDQRQLGASLGVLLLHE